MMSATPDAPHGIPNMVPSFFVGRIVSVHAAGTALLIICNSLAQGIARALEVPDGFRFDMGPLVDVSEVVCRRIQEWRGARSCVPVDRDGGGPVWSRDGIIAVANAHKGKVRLTFDHGASLADPDKLFNAGLEGNQRRAIDFFESDMINERALKNRVRAAVDYNQIKLKKKASASTRAKSTQK